MSVDKKILPGGLAAAMKRFDELAESYEQHLSQLKQQKDNSLNEFMKISDEIIASRQQRREQRNKQ